MIRKQGHWEPYKLTPRDIEKRFLTCELLLQQQKRKGFLYRILFSASVSNLHDGASRRSQPPDSGFSEAVVVAPVVENNNNGPISLREMQNIANNNALGYIATEDEEAGLGQRVDSRESRIEFEPLPLPPAVAPADPLAPYSEWFSTSNENFSRKRLQYLHEISTERYGRIVKGEIERFDDNAAETVVAVKILDLNDPLEKVRFLEEARIYRELKHENILKLITYSLNEQPWLLIFEYCPMRMSELLGTERRKVHIPEAYRLLGTCSCYIKGGKYVKAASTCAPTVIRCLPGKPLKDDQVAQILADGNDSEIEEFADDKDIVARVLNHLEESGSGSGDESSEVDEAPPPIPTTSRRRGSTRSKSGRETSKARGRGRVTGRGQASGRRGTGERVWVETVYTDKAHDYSSLSISQVCFSIDYFCDYLDDSFLEEVARCTNHLRITSIELKTTRLEIAKLFAVHLIMDCIPYPKLPLYWKTGMKLALVSDTMTRDRILILRNALHVVDSDTPAEAEKTNALWKVQLMINKVKETCNRLERVPGYYSIDEHMILFTGRCKLRQVVKNKPRPSAEKMGVNHSNVNIVSP
ncbi:hypothetical protein EVAR_28418_1 [Eumeta japonica]|uniref:Tyrosine-protein kinase catalytic domain-containing protein n=1 Tax=Eumeta variegata TaxID=151549 RepID=A0A4C1V7Z9_EUMVA|nr:hypothetical protein EVAR_28418_1 [Eumeta japonica]